MQAFLLKYLKEIGIAVLAFIIVWYLVSEWNDKNDTIEKQETKISDLNTELGKAENTISSLKEDNQGLIDKIKSQNDAIAIFEKEALKYGFKAEVINNKIIVYNQRTQEKTEYKGSDNPEEILQWMKDEALKH